MKKFLRSICVVLIFSLLLTIPAYADTQKDTGSNTRASKFFSSYSYNLGKVSATTFEISFNVIANAAQMQEIGVSEIVVYRSIDQENWVWVKTYTPEDYPVMMATDTYFHGGYVTYRNAMPSGYYTANITFYAKNSLGIGKRDVYTQIVRMG